MLNLIFTSHFLHHATMLGINFHTLSLHFQYHFAVWGITSHMLHGMSCLIWCCWVLNLIPFHCITVTILQCFDVKSHMFHGKFRNHAAALCADYAGTLRGLCADGPRQVDWLGWEPSVLPMLHNVSRDVLFLDTKLECIMHHLLIYATELQHFY